MNDLFIGRVGRGYFFVGLVIICIVAEFVKMTYHHGNLLMAIAYLTVVIVLLMLSGSLYARRLHDVGKSGYWALVSFVPLVNLILFSYLLFKTGETKKNSYGKPPASFTF